MEYMKIRKKNSNDYDDERPNELNDGSTVSTRLVGVQYYVVEYGVQARLTGVSEMSAFRRGTRTDWWAGEMSNCQQSTSQH